MAKVESRGACDGFYGRPLGIHPGHTDGTPAPSSPCPGHASSCGSTLNFTAHDASVFCKRLLTTFPRQSKVLVSHSSPMYLPGNPANGLCSGMAARQEYPNDCISNGDECALSIALAVVTCRVHGHVAPPSVLARTVPLVRGPATASGFKFSLCETYNVRLRLAAGGGGAGAGAGAGAGYDGETAPARSAKVPPSKTPTAFGSLGFVSVQTASLSGVVAENVADDVFRKSLLLLLLLVLLLVLVLNFAASLSTTWSPKWRPVVRASLFPRVVLARSRSKHVLVYVPPPPPPPLPPHLMLE